MQTYSQFQETVETAISTLRFLGTANPSFNANGFKSIDIDIHALEAAAEIIGCDVTTAKLLNRNFREAATRLAMSRACGA